MKKEIREGIDTLIKNAKNNNNKIEHMTITNFFITLKKDDRTDDTFYEIEQYLIEAGIEIMNHSAVEDDGILSDVRPFNPESIDITAAKITLSSIFQRFEHKEIDFDADFQRRSDLWNIDQQSRLIESIILKIPLPAFYIDATDDRKWLIIDGLQRMTALKKFAFVKSLKLSGLEFFSDFNGIGYDDLPRNFVRRINETEINIYKINPGTPSNVKYNIFKRINTGGLKLEPQEIRNAMYQGTASTLTKEMRLDKNFLLATDNRISTVRMEDREFVARFIAVCYVGVDKYDGVPDNFLDLAMGYMQNLNKSQIAEIKKTFGEVMEICHKIFARNTFRKIAVDERRRPINKAIYEIWCRTIFNCSPAMRQKLVDQRAVVFESFKDLCVNNAYFFSLLKSSDKNSFTNRFLLVEKIIEKII
jgi:hypothetical protein